MPVRSKLRLVPWRRLAVALAMTVAAVLFVVPALAQRSLDRLPRPDAERPGALIGWHVNTTKALIRRARAGQNHFAVLIVHREEVADSVRLLRDVLPCGIVNRLAGKAVFGISSPGRDADLAQVPVGEGQVPLIGVFRMAPDQDIENIGSHSGFVTADGLAEFLAKALGVPTPAHPAAGDADFNTYRAYGISDVKGCATGPKRTEIEPLLYLTAVSGLPLLAQATVPRPLSAIPWNSSRPPQPAQ